MIVLQIFVNLNDTRTLCTFSDEVAAPGHLLLLHVRHLGRGQQRGPAPSSGAVVVGDVDGVGADQLASSGDSRSGG